MSMDKDAFREWRKSLGWSQERAADELGVKRLAVWRWEQGQRMQSERMVELACRQLKTDTQFAEQREQ